MLHIFQDLLFPPPRHLILIIIAAWIGLTLAEKRTERHNISKTDLNNLTFYAILAFVGGGVISFVIQNFTAFTKSSLTLLSFTPPPFEMTGAFAAAAITSLIYLQRKQLPFWSALDAVTPFFAFIAIGMGLSHLASGAAFGLPSQIPWSIELWNAQRHPTQIYETIASSLIFCLLWFKKHDPQPGILFLLYVTLTSAAYVFLLAFRADLTLLPNGFMQEQIIALAVLMLSFVFIEIILKQSDKETA